MAITIIAMKCDPDNPGRKDFRSPELRITLTVPNAYEDKMIRAGLGRGASLYESYCFAQASSLFPVEPMRPCVQEVLEAKGFDPATGTYRESGGVFTCLEFRKCFDKYVRATAKFPDNRGRMEVARGVYSPSSSEELCIKGAFHRSGDIKDAYLVCGALDILPAWTGGAEVIAAALRAQPAADMYDIVKTAYMMQSQEPPPDPPENGIKPPPPDDIPTGKGIPWGIVAVGAALALLSMKR